jgi:Pentapeptide repeats (8 copies)/DinB superfamily
MPDQKGEVMSTFARSSDLRGAEFVGADLRGARFVEADLSGVVMRGVQVEGADIDAPFLFDGKSSLHVNGVDVVPLVEAELNRRFPGRADRRAADPDGLRAAWAALEQNWAATDMWLGRAVLEIKQPFHPIGLTDTSTEADGLDMSIFATVTPSYSEVLEARGGRIAMVREFLASVTSGELAAARMNPHDPEYPETTLSCLHVILNEEWEHHRYAVRDLDAIEAKYDARR